MKLQALRRAIELQDRGKLDKAERLYAGILASQPQCFEALHRLGVLHFRAARYAEALRCLDGAVRVNPTDVVAVTNLARLQARLHLREDALAHFDRAIALNPDFADAHLSRGEILRELGRFEDARASLALASALRPKHAGTLLMLGVTLRELGRLPEALAVFDAALVLDPAFAAAHNNRGIVLRGLKRPEEALAAIDMAIGLEPNFVAAHSNRSNALADLGRFEEALEAANRGLTLAAGFAGAWTSRGNALLGLGRSAAALAAYDRALALEPQSAEINCNRGGALQEMGLSEEALAAFDRALAIQPDFPEALSNRAKSLLLLGRAAEALASCDRALALRPGLAAAHENRGVILTALGRFEEASAAIETALRLAPGNARSYLNLVAARRMKPDDPHLAAMRALVGASESMSAAERADLSFALGKALDDIGDREASFLHLLEANAEQRKLTPYDAAATFARMQALATAFGADLLRRHGGESDLSAKPVFIVGMPRSGTSLAEQILASHPEVFGAGESDDFEREAATRARGAGDGSLAADLAAFVEAGRIRELGAAYVARLAAHAPQAKRIVDKTPSNFRLLGPIHLALPNARVIHMRRDPVDTCLSCFSNRFFGHLPWSYDLAEIGRYYRAYETLMAHWRAALPEGIMIEVRYEDLVGDLEGEARRMLTHIGLDWDARCLDFHATERTVRTASAAQVRQPVYRSSIARWRAIEGRLEPLLMELRPSIGAPR